MVGLDPRMGAFDAVMFGIEDDPLLRSSITLVAMLDRAPDLALVTDRTERLTRLQPRLRQRAVGNPMSLAPPRWEVDPHFDAGFHLRWRRAPGEREALAEVLDFAERMSEADFDRARPLWEAAIITGLVDDQAALIVKIHHCITDGIGGLAMAASLFDLSRDAPEPGDMPTVSAAEPSSLIHRVEQAVGFEVRAAAYDAARLARLAFSTGRTAVTNPVGVTRQAVDTAASTIRMLAPQGRPLSTLMSDRSLSVDFSVVEVPLDALKSAARRHDTTLNTCFLAVVTAALRDYHVALGEQLRRVRVNMPVSVRTDSDEAAGNHWVPARFVMPAEPADVSGLLRRIEPVVRRAQHDPALRASTIVYQLLASLPAPLTTSIAGSLMKGVDVAATNVPGPPMPVYTAGAKVTKLIPFAPKSGAAVNVGLMSYAGGVFLGVNCDPAAVTDSRLFTECVRTALADLLHPRGPQPSDRRLTAVIDHSDTSDQEAKAVVTVSSSRP
ncbi:wax ester/triacylglycerol synthase domain-containing protein [Gordonia polyisoprenivorans]|nr:wax ester/triacylglycerol synthase domain-containing protein [Gordonia polyisoprenivorans]